MKRRALVGARRGLSEEYYAALMMRSSRQRRCIGGPCFTLNGQDHLVVPAPRGFLIFCLISSPFIARNCANPFSSVQNLRFRYKGCPCPLSLNSFLRRSCSAMFTRSGRPVCLPRCACSTLAKPQSSKRGAPALEPFSCFPFRLGIILPLNRAELRNPSWSVREALTDCNQKERATREERRLSRGWL